MTNLPKRCALDVRYRSVFCCQIGGRRCHDLDETQCVIPQLGSGPTTDSGSGTGWYTVSDYQSILSYAAERHITVIPEFDMPGHAHAAIVSMLARYKSTGDTQYLLTDLNDTSVYE
jgi:hexosaminidase